MTMTQKIENRIRKASDLGSRIDATEVSDETREMIVEDTITNVLAELLESLKNSESLTEAIETIQSNF